MSGVAASELRWPALTWSEWSATADTLHMWMQIVGKTRLALTPLQNHWWNVPLYVTARGLGTSAMAYGDDVLDIEFDFVSHMLHLRLGSGKERALPLRAQTVADFYREYLGCLDSLGVSVKINPMPVEVPTPIRFDLDKEHKSYDPEVCAPVLEGAGACGEGISRMEYGISGQGESSAFFLGELRSCSDSVLREGGSATAGCGCDSAGGLLA